jgi:tRNA threonylcarbamoyladenosine biosynthesis protein TsaE
MAQSIPPVRTRERTTHSTEETVAFGRELAREIVPPCLILLEGDLGSGKTTLTKGIVSGLGAAREEDVTSPSFTLVQEYGGEPRVFHADLYRIDHAPELAGLGFEDFLGQRAIVIVEWGEKLWDNAPAPQVVIRMEHRSSEERRIAVEWFDVA